MAEDQCCKSDFRASSSFFRSLRNPCRTGRKAAHNGHQVLDHFLLGRELFLIEHQQLGAMLFAEPLEQENPNQENPNRTRRSLCAMMRWETCPCFDAVHYAQQPLSLHVEATPDLLDVLDIRYAAQKSSSTRRWFLRSGFCAAEDTRQ
jgi:hypothetical protein